MNIRIDTPFAGFYQSYYDSELEYLHERLDDEAEADRILASMDSLVFQQSIAQKYVEFINEELEDLFKVPNLLINPQVHPMTLRNTGDTVSAEIQVNLIPALDELQTLSAAVLDFRAQVIQIAKDKLTSCAGFASFHNPDIQAEVLEKPYNVWNHAYLTCLLGAMVAVVGGDKGLHDHDLEEWQASQYDLELNSFAQEYLEKDGGVPELAEASIPTKTGEDHE